MAIYKYLSWIAVILWMILIFSLSSQEAEQSNKLSTEVTEIIVSTIEKVAPDAEFDIRSLNNTIRKNAHFFTYLVLGILAMAAFRVSGVDTYKSIAWAISICIIYAAIDKIHQIFVPGRGAQFKDIIIDSAGAVVGIGIYLAVGRIYNEVAR